GGGEGGGGGGGGGRGVFWRRGRGAVPASIRLPAAGPSILALGGYFKNTVCLTRGDEAFLSQHLGDLDHAATLDYLAEAADHLAQVLEIRPEAVACDLHPDLPSTRLAEERAQRLGLPLFRVQHHHAHIAAVAAEHGEAGPVVGLALDGVGYGVDGTPWGGELLRVVPDSMVRLGRMRPLPLPGGDRAAREPWRMALAVRWLLGREASELLADPLDVHAGGEVVLRMLQRGVNSPLTSSAGRWFDAAAGVLGVCRVMSFEGQAAMRLEGLAEVHGPVEPWLSGFELNSACELDLLPLLARLDEEHRAGRMGPEAGAALFHATLAEGLARWAGEMAETLGLQTVALGGGCFLNRVLTGRLVPRLEGMGVRVLTARQAPSNDGGLSLGQAWVAMNRWSVPPLPVLTGGEGSPWRMVD
ncbi:MAG: carbamoyltransferase HypF, partial [Magnetococcales bacterium]|nr:carbamoyltransferase HypF [Magnetococcales bacterium]